MASRLLRPRRRWPLRVRILPIAPIAAACAALLGAVAAVVRCIVVAPDVVWHPLLLAVLAPPVALLCGMTASTPWRIEVGDAGLRVSSLARRRLVPGVALREIGVGAPVELLPTLTVPAFTRLVFRVPPGTRLAAWPSRAVPVPPANGESPEALVVLCRWRSPEALRGLVDAVVQRFPGVPEHEHGQLPTVERPTLFWSAPRTLQVRGKDVRMAVLAPTVTLAAIASVFALADLRGSLTYTPPFARPYERVRGALAADADGAPRPGDPVPARVATERCEREDRTFWGTDPRVRAIRVQFAVPSPDAATRERLVEAARRLDGIRGADYSLLTFGVFDGRLSASVSTGCVHGPPAGWGAAADQVTALARRIVGRVVDQSQP